MTYDEMTCDEMTPVPVVTWQSPRGQRIHICRACQAAMESADVWPHDTTDGQSMCSVYHGQHDGYCTVCLEGGVCGAARALNIR